MASVARLVVFSVFFQAQLVFGQTEVSQNSIQVQEHRHPLNEHHKYWKAIRVPLMLTTAGLAVGMQNNVFDRWDVREVRQQIAPQFHSAVDNFMVAAPIAATFSLDAVGIRPRSDLINQMVLLAKSEVIVATLTVSLKNLIDEQRPDGTTHDSFPSGHTSHAFMAATFLHKEFGEDRPWINILGYTTASGVGVMRILNDRHWLSDVLVGAGIGIFSTNISYVTHRYKWGRHRLARQATILPFYQQGCSGFYFSYRLAK